MIGERSDTENGWHTSLAALLELLTAENRSPDRLFECRRCGQTVAADEVRCPDCEARSIARYDFTS